MKNKVGVLTFQNAINYGAALQTYALNKYLNEIGISCETIDYRCKYIEDNYKLLSFEIKDMKKTINMIINLINNYIRKRKFNDFKAKYIKLSDKSYCAETVVNLNKEYNVFITGSDQVWNVDLCNDFNYFLPFVNDNNSRVSFAASFGNIKVLENNEKIIKNILAKYKKISTREKSGKIEIENKLGLECNHVLDPTFLLTDNEWSKLIPKRYEIEEKYILLYILHEESSYEIARKISEETGFKVYIITQSRRKRIEGKYIRNAGPIDFLALIKNSEYVVTDSFHGTALSIIFRKNLKVVLKNKNKYLNDRLVSIINELNLEDCIVNNNSYISKLVEKTNYYHSENILNSRIQDSQAYLAECLIDNI